MVAGIDHTPDERFEPSSARSRMTRTGAVDQVAKNRRARGGAADFIQPPRRPLQTEVKPARWRGFAATGTPGEASCVMTARTSSLGWP